MKKRSYIPPCPICGQPVKCYRGTRSLAKTCLNPECTKLLKQRTNLTKYGHISNLHGNSDKSLRFILKNKYGVTNVSQIPEIKTKIGLTWKNKTKEELSAKKQKTKITSLIKYGVEHPRKSKEIINKQKQTNLLRYGVSNTAQLQSVQDKMKKTCLKRYGVTNIQQNASFQEEMKNKRYKRKIYIFPSGRIVKVQGYEHLGLKFLLNQGVQEQDIILDLKEMPKIIFLKNSLPHRYFPDIYVPINRFIYEVKSYYTYLTELEENKLKCKACQDLGYNFEFLIFDEKAICYDVSSLTTENKNLPKRILRLLEGEESVQTSRNS